MIPKWFMTSAVISGMIFSPMLAVAAPRPMPDEYSSGSPHQARRLLRDIQQEARQVDDRAVRLQDYESAANLDWGPHIHQFNRIRSEINRMGRQLNTLQAMEGPLGPSEQQAINDATPIVREMASNTTDALSQLRDWQAQFWSAQVKASTDNIEHEAGTLIRTIHADLG